jgi:hypothetical protein
MNLRKVSIAWLVLLLALGSVLLISGLLVAGQSAAAQPTPPQPTPPQPSSAQPSSAQPSSAQPSSTQRARPMRPPDALEKDKGFFPTTAPGIPAIKPRTDSSNLDPNTPAFTAEDVRSHIERTHGVGLVSGMDPDAPLTITKIEFVTEGEVRARHHGARTGHDEGTLLCYVELAGTFYVAGPPPASSERCGRAIVILHGHTGNLLMAGIDCKVK